RCGSPWTRSSDWSRPSGWAMRRRESGSARVPAVARNVRVWPLALLVGCGSAAGGAPPVPDGRPTTPPPVWATLGPTALGGSSLAIDSAFLYFTTSTAAMRVPLAGGAPLVVAAAMRGPLVLDASNVYGFDATGIVSAPKTGGTPVSVRMGAQ